MPQSRPLNVPDSPSLGPLPARAGDLAPEVGSGQQFYWGQVKWLVAPDSLGTERVCVGLVSFNPGTDDQDHSHFGEEQVLHVITGSGRHTVNGQTSYFTASDTLYIPPYSRHNMVNTTEAELRLLTVYIPSRIQPIVPGPDLSYCELDHKFDLLSFLDKEAVQKLLDELANSLNQSIRLISPEGDCLMVSDNRPLLCRRLEKCGDHCRRNIKKGINEINSWGQSHFINCCGRVTSIIIPIITRNIISGYIKCGEFFLSSEDQSAMRDFLAEPGRGLILAEGEDPETLTAGISLDKKNRIYTLAENTQAVARYIAEMSMVIARQKEQEYNQLSLLKGRMIETQLKQALQEAELKLLQSRLNPHFLFNTLNTIGHLAYLEGAEKAAGLVHNLSGILRTALGKVKTLIPLSEEVDLLKGYLNIQKARFGRKLQTTIEIDQELGDFLIPGLTLQPIVENSVIHGLESNLGQLHIEIKIRRSQDKIRLSVVDNGPGLMEGPAQPYGVGLNSVIARLRHHFQDYFSFNLVNRPEGGVQTLITLPLTYNHKED